ncbi:MAG: hypothetical protein GYA57_06565 [Myxococcales bacterium]|nr:hypothetical protein [Myxococcales bacterium]
MRRCTRHGPDAWVPVAVAAILALAGGCAEGAAAGEAGPEGGTDAEGRHDADAGTDAGGDPGPDPGLDAEAGDPGIDLPPFDGADGEEDGGGEADADAGPWCGDFCDPFSIVLLPDTQYYTSKQSWGPDNTYRKQMQWILDHRTSHNIRFVVHLGDITNNNTVDQWEIADRAHRMLDDAGVPYSVVPGNHDYLSPFSRSGTRFNDYFGPTRFAGRPWYGGHYGGGNESNYALFEVGPMRFLVLNLEYGPRKDPLCWAEEVIAAHPDRQVIVVSHCVLTHGGAYDHNCPNVDYLVPGGHGETIWDELVARHSNVFLVLCGHVGDSELVPRAGNGMNLVHQMLVDYQFEAACTAAAPASCTAHCQDGTYTGNGWMRELVFHPLEGRIEARTFTVEDGNAAVFPGGRPWFFCSPADPVGPEGHRWYPSDPSDTVHQFSFDHDLRPPATDVRTDLGLRAFTDRTVNAVGTGDQFAPRIAGRAGGDFVVVWEDDSSPADGAGNYDLMARGFAAGGCQRFAQIEVNPTTAGQQRAPAAGMAADGSFVVAWEDDNDGNGVYQVYARGFRDDGRERFAVRTVNSVAAGQQRHPAVAVAPDGRFVVAWEDDQDNDGDLQVWMRGFEADGSERFADRSAHDDDAGNRRRPALAALPDGGFVVVWEDDGDGNGYYQIHARGFGPDGAERFARLTVNSVADGQQDRPAVAADAAGGFVVLWQDDQENDGNYQIYARGFEADGRPRFADLRVNGDAGGQHLAPAVSVADSGAFVAVWQDDSDGNGSYQIRARAFTAAGSERRAEWTANRFADGQQRAPDAFLERSGGPLVVVWEDDMDGNGAYQILAGGLDLSP